MTKTRWKFEPVRACADESSGAAGSQPVTPVARHTVDAYARASREGNLDIRNSSVVGLVVRREAGALYPTSNQRLGPSGNLHDRLPLADPDRFCSTGLLDRRRAPDSRYSGNRSMM
jgi:hypothetical protein